MTIKIQHKNFEITESVNEKIQNVFLKFYKFVNEESVFEILLERDSKHHKQGEVYKIKAEMKNGKNFYHIEVSGEDVYMMIDEAGEKLEREIKEGGDKKRSLTKKLGRKFKDIFFR
jgi:ribosomal subunit interface protein